MPHRLHRKRAVASSLREIAASEVDAALAALGHVSDNEAEAVHSARQQFKRLRALLRLPGRSFPDHAVYNLHFRDLARQLAHRRDADVLLATYDRVALEAGMPDGEVRRRLQSAVDTTPTDRPDVLVSKLEPELLRIRGAIGSWTFTRTGFALVGPGMARVFTRMRNAQHHARDTRTPAAFHEWRKQVKYHANQLRLIAVIAPKIVKSYRRTADKLADILGDHHDLDVLAEALQRLGLPQAEIAPLLEVISSRANAIESHAFRLGDELAAERPKTFRRRIRATWRAWRR